jgi:hypothetical protein
MHITVVGLKIECLVRRSRTKHSIFGVFTVQGSVTLKPLMHELIIKFGNLRGISHKRRVFWRVKQQCYAIEKKVSFNIYSYMWEGGLIYGLETLYMGVTVGWYPRN